MVQTVLRQLDAWYKEPTQGGDRPKLLSKLAVLELCGWIECELDRLVFSAQTGRLDDLNWVRSNITEKTHGFTYADHFRPMLVRLVGEVFVRRIEATMEANHPGELDRLKSSLGQLWKQRCGFAHADVTANVAAQQKFDAPSWSINQHRVISRILQNYENCMTDVLRGV